MATANELLNALINSDEDRTLVINNDLRTITIPDIIKALGVQNDDDVHRLQFAMPRMYGDTDLSTFNIRINYLNAGNKGDVYVVTDKVVKTSRITFSWLVGPNALAYKGNVNFIVCMKESDSDGTVLREFNTTVASLPVLEGLEVDVSVVSDDLVDVLEQLQSLTVAKVAEVEAEGSTQIAKVQEESSNQQEIIVEKGAEVLATIPEDYQTTTELANEGVRTKADAIVETVEGDVISMYDSSDDHIRGLKLFGKTTQVSTTGKNLFDVSQIATSSQLTIDDNVITVTTPSSSSAVTSGKKLSELAPNLEAGTSYILTFDTTGSDKFIYLDGAGFSWNPGATRTITQEALDSTVLFYASGVSTSAKITNVMIRLASVTDTTYEPYSGGVASPSPDWSQDLTDIERPVVKVFGKNLLDLSRCDIARCTNNNGVLTSDIEEHYYATLFYAHLNDYLFNNLGKTFTFSVDHTNADAYLSIIILGNRLNGSTFQEKKGEYGSRSVSITVADDFTSITNIELRWNRKSKTFTDTISTITNIQFELGTAATEYEPYKEAQSISVVHTIPGIQVTSGGNYTDENGQQWICDEVDLERGVYVKRICYADLANATIVAETYNSINRFVARSDEIKAASAAGVGLCNIFKVGLGPVSGNVSDNTISGFYAGNAVYWRCDACATVDEMIDLVQERGAVYLYPLLEPVETPLTADEITAFKALRTNYPNTTILNDAGAWMSVKYNADTKTYIENPKTLKLVDSSTGVVYELKIVDGNLTIIPV